MCLSDIALNKRHLWQLSLGYNLISCRQKNQALVVKPQWFDDFREGARTLGISIFCDNGSTPTSASIDLKGFISLDSSASFGANKVSGWGVTSCTVELSSVFSRSSWKRWDATKASMDPDGPRSRDSSSSRCRASELAAWGWSFLFRSATRNKLHETPLFWTQICNIQISDGRGYRLPLLEHPASDSSAQRMRFTIVYLSILTSSSSSSSSSATNQLCNHWAEHH